MKTNKDARKKYRPGTLVSCSIRFVQIFAMGSLERWRETTVGFFNPNTRYSPVRTTRSYGPS